MTLLESKELAVIPVTTVLCELTLRDGSTLHWASVDCSLGTTAYEARVSDEQSAPWRFQNDLTADGSATLQLYLANADGAISELRRVGALKGARVRLLAAALNGREVEATHNLFTGIVDNVLDADSRTARLTVLNRLSAVRSSFPPLRIQKQCAWTFPKNEAERTAALSTGEDGRYAPLFRCGYSAGLPGGVGNLNGNEPFTSCNFSRKSCEERGMFRADSSSTPTRRFSGIEFVPPVIQVRGHGESSGRLSSLVSLDTRYNDVVPAVYGMGWLQAPVVFSRNDGNLTRAEVLLGLGEIEEAVKVVVNGYEIPRAVDGQNMTGTGWFQLVSCGGRTGDFNLNFTDGAGAPMGDPYGSLAYLSVVVPNKISDGKSSPRVEVLVKGIRLPALDLEGLLVAAEWSSNPAWIMLDILRRTGWKLDELNIASFISAAAYCDQAVTVKDANGNSKQVKRFECNLVLRRKYSVAELLRGIRQACLLRLGLDSDGKVFAAPESTIAAQQPLKPAGSNADDALDGGWPAYEFDDGLYGKYGLLLKGNGDADFHLFSRASLESANRVSVEIQDALNEFRQDSVSVADTVDIDERRQEIQQSLPVLGLPNLPQAVRVAQTWLNKTIAGNVYAQFRTTLRGIHIRPGDLILVTYEKHGLDRTIMRVLETQISPRLDTMEISCQLHQDHWYSDDPQARYDRSRLYSWANRAARAVVLLEPSENLATGNDGQEKCALRIPFVRPKSAHSGTGVPLVSFRYSITDGTGSVAPGQYFYGLTALDGDGNESELSTLIPVNIETSGGDHTVSLEGLSFAPGTQSVRVYRGPSPYRLSLIADEVLPNETITDGVALGLNELPPDANYARLRSYFRREFLPAQTPDAWTSLSISKNGLGLTPDEWNGKLVTIRAGKGLGQERLIVSHTPADFLLDQPWTTLPDATSRFAIVQAEWTRAEESESSEIVVFLPLLSAEVFEVSLRSVAADGDELEAAESPSVVWQIGVGSTTGSGDSGVPPEASFALRLPEGGTITIGGLALTQFTNLATVYAARLGLMFWDELTAPTPLSIAADIANADTFLTVDGLTQPLSAEDFLQVGQEVIQVVSRVAETSEYEVARGSHNSPASAHSAGSLVFRLERQEQVIPLVPGLLTSTAAARFRYPIRLPYVRLAAADFVIYNRFGGSSMREECYTQFIDEGIRTLSGGQIAFSAPGYLAIEASVGSAYVSDRMMAVGDIYAVISEPPVGAPVEILVRVDGLEYGTLTIAAGSFTSAALSKLNAAPIPESARITFDILSVPSAAQGSPGRDLTVFLQV